jgi:hypothetical protein
VTLKLADGKYRLTQTVRSPVPTRLHSRRCGWQRQSTWHSDTYFTVLAGKWTCDSDYRTSRSALLPSKWKQAVFEALKPYLELWSATLPSHVLKGWLVADDVLDHLVAIGRLTLAEVQECATHVNVGEHVGEAMTALCKPAPAPASVPQHVPPAPVVALRVGDIIESSGDECVVLEALAGASGAYRWQSGDSPGFVAFFYPNTEKLIGHISDRIAEAMTALCAPGAPASSSLPQHVPGALRIGDVIRTANGRLFAVCSGCDDQYQYVWTTDSCDTVSDRHRKESEPIVGHVADMLAEGLAAFSTRVPYSVLPSFSAHRPEALGTSSSDDCWSI